VDLTAGHTKEDITEERDWPLCLSLERALEIMGETSGGRPPLGREKVVWVRPGRCSGWLCGDAEVAVLSPDASQRCRSSGLAKQSETRRYTDERIAGGRAARMCRVQTNLKGEIV
jgi:hypothetical protein